MERAEDTQAIALDAKPKNPNEEVITLDVPLVRGNITIPDQTYTLEGIKAEITEQIWVGGNIRHSFSPEAFTTSLELESKLPDEEVADLAEGGQGNYTGIVAWYRDEKTGEQKQVTKGDQTNPRRLVHLYASKANAERAAEREWKRLQISWSRASAGLG